MIQNDILRIALIGFLSSLASAPAYSALTDGRYGSAQVFDTQRNPPFPSASVPITLSGFARPFASVAPPGQYDILPGQYISFFRAVPGQAPGDLCNYGIRLHNADGSENRIISAGGAIYGLDAVGFLHTSTPGNFGTFVTNNAGYAYGGGLTYTPTSGQATCAAADAYVANTTPIQLGGGPTPTPTPTPTPIPALSDWGVLITVALLAGFLLFGRGRRPR